MEDSVDIHNALNAITGRQGHIEVQLMPDAIRSLFTGRLVISAPKTELQSTQRDDEPRKAPRGLVNLNECAEYLSSKFAHQFTESELKEWCDAGYIPHVKVRDKGIACHVSKVVSWITQHFLDVCDGKPFPWGVHNVFLGEKKPPASIPCELVGIAEQLSFVPLMSIPPCVYFLVSDRSVVYVGQSVNLLSRIGQHTDKIFDEVYFLPVPVSRLNEVEQAFIRTMHPKYNAQHGNSDSTERDLEIIAEVSSKQQSEVFNP